MFYLIIATFIWAFSFPLIGYYISGQMDSFFAAFMRVFLAFLVFLPFLNFGCKFSLKLKLMGIGAMQIGIMYLFYYHSFAYLSVSEIALFTIFTPFYIALVYDICSKRFRPLYFVSIGICTLGAVIIKFSELSSHFLFGFFLIQMANLSFGAGQSLYKLLLERENITQQRQIFGYFHLGAVLITLPAFLLLGDSSNLPKSAFSWGILLYLGFIASGLGYFLYNKGATKVDSGVLALMHNALIPAAILVNAVFWHIDFEYKRLILGSCIMVFSLWLHYKIIAFYEKKAQESS
ncbi:hypothetical protein DMB92_01725 [Campylobacter sp. MIT 99-7217]|uniref:EamA family transporter n=1 Tax=Campylobacter sp. MIT 99-7217 TaxID=535091 RepID=UPI00115A1BC3|nr:EamA family transporter [Campylobacter sp. MIT 99-7217]TQR34704.1 hypothetical protein DMB92_01725 [Campylobacter sp. MIT 99-7217]